MKAKIARIEENNAHSQSTISNDLTRTISLRRLQRNKAEIMVAGDDEFSKQMIECVLKKDFQTRFAGDASETVWKYVALAPDILFLDSNLTDDFGADIIDKILKYDPHAHIVIFSGNCALEYVPESIHPGAKGFVSKPYSRQKLMEHIEKSEHMLPRLVENAILK